MKNKWFFLILLFIFSGKFVYADCDIINKQLTNKKKSYNPQPSSDDIILPMPCDLKMVFRQVIVPGENFWGDQERVIEIGDASGGMFEVPLKTSINGSFYEPTSKRWSNYLGKYEVSKAQFIAVMGIDVFRKEVLESEQEIKNLAEPISGVNWLIYQEFIHRYNLWLFDKDNPKRVAALPKHEKTPGFIRLPTELEWEYAARGGYDVQAKKLAEGFNNKLPFPENKIKKYAWHLGNAKEKKRIGLKNPNRLHLYDMFGNVQELTVGLFLPEHWLGKPGGVIARGGDIDTEAEDLRSSRRKEVEIYKWKNRTHMTTLRSYATGIRLAIGSNVFANDNSLSNIKTAHDDYKKDIRKNLPIVAMLATTSATSSAVSNLQQAINMIDQLEQKNKGLVDELGVIKTRIEQAKQQLDIGLTEAARSYAQDAWTYGVLMGQDIIRIAILKNSLVTLEELAQLSTRYQSQVFNIQEKIKEREKHLNNLLEAYVEKVKKLSGFTDHYIKIALTHVKQLKQTVRVRSRIVLPLLEKHVREYQQNLTANSVKWLQEFEAAFNL